MANLKVGDKILGKITRTVVIADSDRVVMHRTDYCTLIVAEVDEAKGTIGFRFSDEVDKGLLQ